MAEKVNAGTVRLDLALLSRLFELAASSWGMENLKNPVKRTAKPRLAQGRERRLKKHEEAKLLSAASKKLQPIIEFALETAMRRSEIASLTWECIDFKQRTALLIKTKNGEMRSVPLSPKALKILKRVQGPNTKVVHIHDNRVFQVTSNHITDAFSWACSKAKIKDLRFHDLRHEATSRFFENTDLDVMEIRAITGHKSMQMLARYSHLRSHRLADRLAGRPRTGG